MTLSVSFLTIFLCFLEQPRSEPFYFSVTDIDDILENGPVAHSTQKPSSTTPSILRPDGGKTFTSTSELPKSGGDSVATTEHSGHASSSPSARSVLAVTEDDSPRSKFFKVNYFRYCHFSTFVHISARIIPVNFFLVYGIVYAHARIRAKSFGANSPFVRMTFV